MWYILGGLISLFVIVWAATAIKRKFHPEEQDTEIHVPDAGCCGAHEICERGLKKIVEEKIEYFDDEELDCFKGRKDDSYTAEEIEAFRDVLYTLAENEITDWMVSLEKRGIDLPQILRQEAIEMING